MYFNNYMNYVCNSLQFLHNSFGEFHSGDSEVGVEWPVLRGLTIPRRRTNGHVGWQSCNELLKSEDFHSHGMSWKYQKWMVYGRSIHKWMICGYPHDYGNLRFIGGFRPPQLLFGGLWPLDRRGLKGWRQEVHCQLQLEEWWRMEMDVANHGHKL